MSRLVARAGKRECGVDPTDFLGSVGAVCHPRMADNFTRMDIFPWGRLPHSGHRPYTQLAAANLINAFVRKPSFFVSRCCGGPGVDIPLRLSTAVLPSWVCRAALPSGW